MILQVPVVQGPASKERQTGRFLFALLCFGGLGVLGPRVWEFRVVPLSVSWPVGRGSLGFWVQGLGFQGFRDLPSRS